MEPEGAARLRQPFRETVPHLCWILLIYIWSSAVAQFSFEAYSAFDGEVFTPSGLALTTLEKLALAGRFILIFSPVTLASSIIVVAACWVAIYETTADNLSLMAKKALALGWIPGILLSIAFMGYFLIPIWSAAVVTFSYLANRTRNDRWVEFISVTVASVAITVVPYLLLSM